MKISTLIPWYGSNRMLRQRVGAELGKLEWAGVPFAGGMCELPEIQARTINANDLHRHAINLAMVVATPGLRRQLHQRLKRRLFHPETLWWAQQVCIEHERATEQSDDSLWDHPDLATRPVHMPDVQWAEAYFITAWMSRSGTAGTRQEFSAGQSVRWDAGGGDSAVRYYNAVRGLHAWGKATGNVTFTTLDALEFIAKVKDLPGYGIYCDPPFPGPGDKYRHTVDEKFQAKLATACSRFQHTRVVMRFYDHPLIRELYPTDWWTWIFQDGRTQANSIRPEVLLINGPGYTRGAA